MDKDKLIWFVIITGALIAVAWTVNCQIWIWVHPDDQSNCDSTTRQDINDIIQIIGVMVLSYIAGRSKK